MSAQSEDLLAAVEELDDLVRHVHADRPTPASAVAQVATARVAATARVKRAAERVGVG